MAFEFKGRNFFKRTKESILTDEKNKN
jgi:hypothetical protein